MWARQLKKKFVILRGTLDVSLLGIMLVDKAKIPGQGVIRGGEGTIRAVQDFWCRPHLLTNFEIQKYYQNEPKFNGAYSRNNLLKIKDGSILKTFWWVKINRNLLDSFVSEWW